MTANLQPPGAWAGGSGPGYFQPPPNSRPMPETGFGGFNPQMRPGQAYNPGGPNDMPVDMGWGAADNGPPIPPGAMPGPNTFLKGAPDIMSTGGWVPMGGWAGGPQQALQNRFAANQAQVANARNMLGQMGPLMPQVTGAGGPVAGALGNMLGGMQGFQPRRQFAQMLNTQMPQARPQFSFNPYGLPGL